MLCSSATTGARSTVYGAAGHAPDRWRRVVAMAVPPGGALAHAFVTNLAQVKRSWYMFFFQHPLADLLVGADDLAFIDMLWRDWSPGFDAAEELALLKPSLRDPAHLAAAVGYYRARLGDGKKDPALDAVQQATQDVPPQPLLYLHGAGDGCIGVEVAESSAGRWCPTTSRSRSSTAAATSSTSSSPLRSTAASSGSWRRERSPAPARRPRRGREAGLPRPA